jgi:Ni/Co efflux regulator RcnB
LQCDVLGDSRSDSGESCDGEIGAAAAAKGNKGDSMKRRLMFMTIAAAILMFVSGTAVRAQEDKHWDKDHPMFNQNEHEQIKLWYEAHHDQDPKGFRTSDKVPAAWTPKLKPGFVLDQTWRDYLHVIPPSLGFKLRHPPLHYQIYALSGNIVLVNHSTWEVADVIHVTNIK